MLTSETKQKINNCRDYLVGKIPDPKGQIDQITNALIYKFMSDQDRLAKEIGGNASFFVDQGEKESEKYEKYSWEKLFDTKLTNEAKAKLYIDGIEQLSKAKHLPELFRDIFKNAFLPFRDANTIVLFLTEINKFDYHHSEELGNAFEYLLSIMGSQGNAGQFRTPRHIIEFLVDVVDPKSGETIYDPACGTAGFLISAFTHITENNPKLSVPEKLELYKNISGVDIDPGMAKIARVNLYLHGFKTPKITEDDTLSNIKLWENKYDVILANPPFMTPKGGIKVHEGYSIKSTKAEVLFTDYIAEHLRLKGRAGIIVPEGIIFQSANAYKDLRKMLVEQNLLYAVVSLPSGIFQPYSGVKTSILFLDRELASKTDKILFVKVENDGYDLGAQRRPIGYEYNSQEVKIHVDAKFKAAFDIENDVIIGNKLKDKVEYEINGKKYDFSIFNKNDLPITKYIINVFGNMIKLGNVDSDFNNFLSVGDYKQALLVEKSKIAQNGEYNLSAERYRENFIGDLSSYVFVELGEKIKTITASIKIQKNEFLEKGEIPVIDQSQNFISGYTNNLESKITVNKPLVIFGDHTCTVKYIDFNFAQGADGIKILETTEDLNSKFLYYNLLYKPLQSDGYQRHFTKLKLYKIPLPSLEIQEQIVEELDNYQKIIDGAKQIVENYKPKIKIDESWEVVELGELAENTKLGLVRNKGEQGTGEKKYVKMDCINEKGQLDLSKYVLIYASEKELSDYGLEDGDFLYNTRNAPNLVGKNTVYHGPNNEYIFNNNLLRIRFNNKVISDYITYYLNQDEGIIQIKSFISGTTSVAALYWKEFSTIKIPLPPLEIQEQIVTKIEEEQKMVESAKGLIEVFENKIKERIGKVWGENLDDNN